MKSGYLALALVVLAFFPANTFANGITNDTNYPKSDVIGKINGSGSYQLDPGWSVLSMDMYALPDGEVRQGRRVARMQGALGMARLPD